MSRDKNIGQLTALASADVATTDSLVVFDASAPTNSRTKRMTAEGLANAMPRIRTAYDYARSEYEIIAHRGFKNVAPEATLAAISAGAGVAHSVEFDVQFSSDGEPVVIHDSTVDRTTDGTGAVNAKTLATLQALDAGSWFDARFADARIPTFGDALREAAANYRLIYPEIKDVRTLADVATFMSVIIDAHVEDRCIVTSFETDRLAAARTYSSRVVLGYTADSSGALATIKPLAKDDGNAVIFISHSLVDAALVTEMRDAGVDIVVWTVNDTTTARSMVDLGVNRICTDLCVHNLLPR